MVSCLIEDLFPYNVQLIHSQTLRAQSPLNPFSHDATCCWLGCTIVSISLLLPSITQHSVCKIYMRCVAFSSERNYKFTLTNNRFLQSKTILFIFNCVNIVMKSTLRLEHSVLLYLCNTRFESNLTCCHGTTKNNIWETETGKKSRLASTAVWQNHVTLIPCHSIPKSQVTVNYCKIQNRH